MLERIRELIREAMEEFSAKGGPPPEADAPQEQASDWEVLPAESMERGHFSTNAAFVYALSLSKGGKKILPLAAAEKLKKYFEEKGSGLFSKIEVAEPGFLNFWLVPEVIREEFQKMVSVPPSPSAGGFGVAKQRIIVEYSQPNIAKPLQAHHLRSTIIGDALANILEFAGHEVVRWNYLGDWGTHFGKLIALTKRKGPKEEWVNVMRDVQGSAAIYSEYRVDVEKEPDLEEQAREEFKKLEEGDPENRKLWEESRSASIEKLKELYKTLGVDFDEWIGESFYEAKLPRIIEELEKKNIAKESEGAIVIPLEEYNLPSALIRKSDGATLYLTRDIASLEHRLEEYKPKSILYVVDNGQTLHFQQLFAIAKILGLKGDFIHIKFGLLLGKDLKKLSSRAGTGIELKAVIDEAISRARRIIEEKQWIRPIQQVRQAHYKQVQGKQAQGESDMGDKEKEEVARVVGIGALKYNDLSQSRVANIAFDWDKMLSLQGNSAPYLQYTYARLKSILRKIDEMPKLDTGAIEKESDLRLVLKLAYFPEVIKAVSENYLPHQVANYLYDLARAINDYYEKEPILKAEEPLRGARLHLIQSAATTLKTGLALLGIKTVERM